MHLRSTANLHILENLQVRQSEIGDDYTNFSDTGITLQSNTISNSIFGGMLVKSCSSFVFNGNTINSPYLYGISIKSSAAGYGVSQ